MNYYERHLGDYTRDTAHLTMIEHGAYSLLLDRYYITEGAIPADQVYRVVRARTKEEKAAVDVVLSEFFKLVDGVWVNDRAEKEIKKAKARINTARENGKKGGRPKTKNNQGSRSENETHDEPNGNPVGSENETHDEPNGNPVGFGSGMGMLTTRKGELCRQLRSLGIDAAPHLQGWTELLPVYSDAEIIAAAEIAREKKPGERLHLNYLLPILRDKKEVKAKAAQVAVSSRESRESRIDSYVAQAAAARSNHGDGERTIEGEAIRIT